MKPPDSYNGGNYVKYVLLHCDAQHDDDETICYVFVHLKFEKICVIMKKIKNFVTDVFRTLPKIHDGAFWENS